MNYRQLSDRARYFKETEEGARRMSDWMKSYVDEEVHKEFVEKALLMIADGDLSLEKISRYSGLSLDEVEELAGNKSA